MIYILSAILVGFGAWYFYHVWQKVIYKRKVREAVKERPVPTYDTYFGAPVAKVDQDERVWEITPEELAAIRPFDVTPRKVTGNPFLKGNMTDRARYIKDNTDWETKMREAGLSNPVESPNPARLYTQMRAREENTSSSDYLATLLIADAFISTPDTTESFSGGGGDFGGGGASGSWDSSPDTSSSYDSGSSSSYDSGGGSDSGSFGGSD